MLLPIVIACHLLSSTVVACHMLSLTVVAYHLLSPIVVTCHLLFSIVVDCHLLLLTIVIISIIVDCYKKQASFPFWSCNFRYVSFVVISIHIKIYCFVISCMVGSYLFYLFYFSRSSKLLQYNAYTWVNFNCNIILNLFKNNI